MGGEKLKPFRYILAIFLIALGNFSLIFAQDQSPDVPRGEESLSSGVLDTTVSPPGGDPSSGEQASSQQTVPGEAASDQSQMFLDEETPGAPADVSPASTIYLVLRMVLVLALAAGAVYGILLFVKRMSRPASVQDPYLKVLSSVHLGSNRYVHVVSLGQKAYLLGASDGGVSLITEIDDKETVDAMRLDGSRRTGSGRNIIDFRSIFTRLSGSRLPGLNGEAPSLDAPSPDFVKKRRERFRGS